MENQFMANNDVVDRNKILGSATQDYGFDKVLRGYDIKQVNEYISNLLATNKNAGELFDQRYEELKIQSKCLNMNFLNQRVRWKTHKAS